MARLVLRSQGGHKGERVAGADVSDVSVSVVVGWLVWLVVVWLAVWWGTDKTHPPWGDRPIHVVHFPRDRLGFLTALIRTYEPNFAKM